MTDGRRRRERCNNPIVRADPLAARCERPKGHPGKHRTEWYSEFPEEDAS